MQRKVYTLNIISIYMQTKQDYSQLHLFFVPISPEYAFLISYNVCEIGHESVVLFCMELS